MRPLSLGLLAALTACADPGLNADDALEAAHAAAEAGDARHAMAMIDHAAETGDLDALEYRDRVYGRGYVQVPVGYVEGTTQQNVALPVFFWHQFEARRDLEAALERGVQAGDPGALLVLADRLISPALGYRDRPADPDSARAIYRALEGADVDPLRLAVLAHNLEDEAGYDRHLARAVASGDHTACLMSGFSRDDPAMERGISMAESVAASVTFYEECRSRALEAGFAIEGDGLAAEVLASLRDEAESGNTEAVALRDDVIATGVLEQHPRLRPFLGA